jgi:hypothetical protein
MHDRVRFGFRDRLAHGARVKQIERDRLRPLRLDTLEVSGRPRGADHPVSSLDQLGNEPGADGTAGPCDEDSHRVLLHRVLLLVCVHSRTI